MFITFEKLHLIIDGILTRYCHTSCQLSQSQVVQFSLIYYSISN